MSPVRDRFMQWTLFELARLARNLVAEDDLVLRDSVIEKLVNKDERKDEDYWAGGFCFDKSLLKVVSLKNSIWEPLKERRPELFADGKGIAFDTPDCEGLYHKLMSYCEEGDRLDKDGNVEGSYGRIIIHNEGDRLCVRRFLEANELLHFVTDTVAEQNVQTEFLSNVLMESSLDGSRFISDVTKPLQPEAVGFYLAIEVMLPWCLRENLNKMIEAKSTNFQIAKAFMVPEFIVRHVRNVHFGTIDYLGVSYRMNSLIDKEEKEDN